MVMDLVTRYSQKRFFEDEVHPDHTAAGKRAEAIHTIGKGYSWQPVPQTDDPTQALLDAPKNSWCTWKKVLIILCIFHVIVLIVAAIVIPIYVSRLVATSTSVFIPNQCSNYTTDTDATRLTTYSVGTGGCDTSLYATATWVRFTGGGATQMASFAPLVNRSGTSGTGWYTGTLPSTTGVTVTGVVCFSYTSTNCDFHSTVSVTNCGSFYIYLLVAPSTCNLRYCTQ